MFAKDIFTVENISAILESPETIAKMRSQIQQGFVYIVKKVIPKETIIQIRNYLEGLGRNSLPNYQAINVGCPNFHRVNYDDDRAYVRGCFHQFSFFPWNQDVFNFFELFKPVYFLKNQLCNISKEKFLGRQPEDGCIARLSFQFYPAGIGRLNKHSDPVDHHQLAVPTLTMSKKGTDFKTGGTYFMQNDTTRVYVDDITDLGDVALFNAVIPHGVDIIDSDARPDWLAFRGRWVMLFATNKLNTNAAIRDAVDLEKKAS